MLGLLVALPAIRLRTDYLAIVTITIGEIFRLVLKSGPGVTELTRGPRGIRGYSNEFYFFRQDIGLGFLSGAEAAYLRQIGIGSLIMAIMIFRPQGILGSREEMVLDR